MEITEPTVQIFMFLFFGVFQTLGAAFIGLGVRAMLNGESDASQIFFGAVFAGAGTLFSFLMMREVNTWSFPLGVFTMFGVILGTVFVPKATLTRFGAALATSAIGAFALFGGAMVFIGTLRAQQEILFGILFGGCWGSVGLAFLLTGVNALLHGKPLRFKPKGAGRYEIVPADDQASVPSEKRQD